MGNVGGLVLFVGVGGLEIGTNVFELVQGAQVSTRCDHGVVAPQVLFNLGDFGGGFDDDEVGACRLWGVFGLRAAEGTFGPGPTFLVPRHDYMDDIGQCLYLCYRCHEGADDSDGGGRLGVFVEPRSLGEVAQEWVKGDGRGSACAGVWPVVLRALPTAEHDVGGI